LEDFVVTYTRNPADARKHETNLLLTKAASAESDDVTRNSYSGFVALRKVPMLKQVPIINKSSLLPQES
jgi:hypothetical protein